MGPKTTPRAPAKSLDAALIKALVTVHEDYEFGR